VKKSEGVTAVTEINIDDVMSVYSGKNGRCCCGCAGKHTYASKWQAAAGKDRGFKVTDDEVNDRTVKLILGKIAKIGGEQYDGPFGSHVSAVSGDRVYVAYLKYGRKA